MALLGDFEAMILRMRGALLKQKAGTNALNQSSQTITLTVILRPVALES